MKYFYNFPARIITVGKNCTAILPRGQKHNYMNIFEIDIFQKIKTHVEEAG